MKKIKSLKTITFSLGLAALMFQAVTVDAQVINRGLLQNPYKEEGKQNGALMRSGSGTGTGTGFKVSTEQFGGSGGGGQGGFNIGTEEFGAPLGSGLFIMAAAGAAYAFSKKRKNQENN